MVQFLEDGRVEAAALAKDAATELAWAADKEEAGLVQFFLLEITALRPVEVAAAALKDEDTELA